eukprot:TRINITY_DN1317_c0_g1_i4.p3 TRINITY_DN1317_c0_g1~~TRINITY_DN1317_c0_g1_i4.p3  ORF type:complete len:107 (-),score=4.92 TRINITY_DN1317_c0_g1_i4:126-446(-)
MASRSMVVMHSCSTVSQNSGSPIIALSDLGSGPIARVMAVHVSSPTDTDDESRNYNAAIYKNHWIDYKSINSGVSLQPSSEYFVHPRSQYIVSRQRLLHACGSRKT